MARDPQPPRRRKTTGAATPVRAPRRGRGRPAADAPELRPRLLDAALACYAGNGIAATSLRDIARQAGVTPALLHYYFGDRAQLLDAVVEERILPVMAGVHAAVADAGDDIGALVVAFVDGMAATIARHPWLPPLWVREVVSEGGALRGLLSERIAPSIARLVAQRFAAAQARGELNPALDPRLLMVSLVGLTLFPAAGAPIWQKLYDATDLGVDDLRRHALALLHRGLELPHA
ncbi:TetR/AcrR family transcriptional regulator [Pseudoxanthomonas koreensis]|uniref:TetR/AcrR family transcriptional regulator n=1 Tax=Pseudoxanthomonas koreensis TaxID=266061 RepID=UPI0013912A96|nr:TetR/AcrR family transcriptional regulator [Pseudoxanthomonas koreensis]KAF1691405.1 TetR family transcriptional regulator [Pseudoxanthomonas koreensis]